MSTHQTGTPGPPGVEQGFDNAPSRALEPQRPDIRLRVLKVEGILDNRPATCNTSVRQLIEKLSGDPGWTILSYRLGYGR